MSNISKEVIRAYALENAIKHEGKANQGSVLSGLFAEGLEKSQIKEFLPKIEKEIKEVNKLSQIKQKDEFEKIQDKVSKREIREGLPDLENANVGKVIMRFAPFPSGPLHIGNLRTAILNDEYVKKYKGKLLLVIDDTIGSAAKPIEKDAYSLIENGLKWAKINFDKKIILKSDRIKKYYSYAEELIKKGYMYVCECDQETMQKLRKRSEGCGCRNYPGHIQIKRWEKMFRSPEGSMTARLKTSMQDKDPAFRDRVMFRISDRPHEKIGTKYRVYPLLDFSWAIDDHLLEITHILRGMELAIETRVEKFIWDIFKWPHPKIIYNGHFELEGVKISKSKSSAEVKSGIYSGWDDPRTWSLQSLEARGILPESLREFIINMGLKKTNVKVPIEVLYTINKKNLENVPRFFFVEDPKRITIKGAPPLTAKIPFHPNGSKHNLGEKSYNTTQEFLITQKDFDAMKNKNYRLMHLLNFKSDNTHPTPLKPREFSFISTEPDTTLNTTFIHWLPANTNNIAVEIIMPDGKRIKGKGEPELEKLLIGSIIQFERFGFARLYKKQKDTLTFMFAHN